MPVQVPVLSQKLAKLQCKIIYLTNETIKKNVFVAVETKLFLLMASSVLTLQWKQNCYC